MATFEWDATKANRNLVVHGVTFDEAMTAFCDSLGRMIEDPRHSGEKPRYVLLAHSEQERLLVIMFTERGARLRLISARRATPTERRLYEETAQ